jgi:glycerol-3-phosphate acyltransferase PlsY
MPELAAIAVAYLVGSIPFAFLLSRRRGIDLRHVGSQNVGATNVLRTSGVTIAVVAMALDAVKGALAVLLAQRLSPGPVMPVAAGLASVIGHVYPVWLRFHGGKGVATAAGVFAILTPVALAAATAVFLVAVLFTRYISVGSIGAAFTLAAVTAAGEAPAVVAVGATVVAAIVLYRHRGNLARLRAGTERRVGQRLFKKVV